METHSTSSFGGITVTKSRPKETGSILLYMHMHSLIYIGMKTDAHRTEEFSSISLKTCHSLTVGFHSELRKKTVPQFNKKRCSPILAGVQIKIGTPRKPQTCFVREKFSETPRGEKTGNVWKREREKKLPRLRGSSSPPWQQKPQNNGSTCFPGLEIQALLK